MLSDMMNRFGMANSALATFLESLHSIRPIRIKVSSMDLLLADQSQNQIQKPLFFVIDELWLPQLYMLEVIPIIYFFANGERTTF